jgi:serine/threonine-protein kinase
MTNPDEPRAPQTTAALSVGDVVADRYRIDAVLGEGGMGVVYRVEHLHLRKLFALKVLLPAWSSMPEVVARFEREAVTAGNIQDPHVVAATDFGRLPSGSFFLVMEYVNGLTLRDVLAGGAMEPARALHVLRGTVSALHAAHALGIVHRDMKPENIMLVERDSNPDFVKVLDFGIAKVDGFGSGTQGGTSKALTQVGAVIGTPDYMSPEQALGQPVDARSDLYSVGVILFEMLTGRCPFEGDAVTVLRQHVMGDIPELPPAVTAGADPRMGAILRRLLAKPPASRFANTADLMAALEECCSEGALPAQPAPMRPSLESIQGMTTPVAQRVRRSVLAGVKAIEGAARRTLDDPKGVLRHATPGQLMVSAIVVAVVATTMVVLLVGGRTHAPTSTAGPIATDSAAVVVPTGTSPLPASTQVGSVAAPSVSILPPPPAPPSSTITAGGQPPRTGPGRPAPSQGQSRQTGPGGIYIPPPSQWFK